MTELMVGKTESTCRRAERIGTAEVVEVATGARRSTDGPLLLLLLIGNPELFAARIKVAVPALLHGLDPSFAIEVQQS